MKKAISVLLSVLLLFGSIPLSSVLVSAADLGENLAASYTRGDGTSKEVTWNFSDVWNNDSTAVSAHGGYGWKIPNWNGWNGTNLYTDKYVSVKASGLKTNTRYQFGFSNGGHYDISVSKIYPASDETATLELLNIQRTAVSDPIYTGYAWVDVTTDFVTNSTDTDYIVVLQATASRGTGSGNPEFAFADLTLREYLSFGDSWDVSTAAEGNGTATVSSGTVANGGSVTFSATPHHMESFIGWYDASGRRVSTDTVYSPIITGTTRLTARFTSITTSAQNLVKDFTKDNGITVTYTDWSRNTTAGESRYGGNGIKIGNGDFDSATNGVELHVTGLEPNTSYRFGFSNNGDHRLVLDSVKSTSGVSAAVTTAINPTNTGWIGTDYTFMTGDEADYVITVAAYNRSKGGSQRGGSYGWSDATVSDFVLVESSAFDCNLAEYYTHASGDVTWTDNADPWGDKLDNKTVSVFGGYGWCFGLANTNANENQIAYVTVKASDLEANTAYDFSYVYSNDYVIKFDKISDPASNRLQDVEEVDTRLATGDRAHQISLAFTTGAAGDYTITLKMAKHWNNANCGWSRTTLSDLVLTKRVSANLAAGYTHANGDVTWTDNAELWSGKADLHEGAFGGYSWEFGMSQTNTTDKVAYVTVKASGLKANSLYEFSYVYQKDYQILFDRVTDLDGDLATVAMAPADTALGQGNRAHSVTLQFKTGLAGDYHIVLKMAKGWNNQDCGWSSTVLSDLSLIEKPHVVLNLAAGYTHANGAVTWTENAGAWGNGDTADGVLGGYCWNFGMPETNTSDNIAYVSIKASALQANTRYRFSYVYSKDYIISFDRIEDASGTALTEALEITDTKLEVGDRAHQISFDFTALSAGDYTIVLKMAKGWNNVNCGWSCTMLSDLRLIELCKDPIIVTLHSDIGGTAECSHGTVFGKGTKVELTATPDQGNTFDGWYDAAGNKVSDEAQYVFVANEAFELTAKFKGDNMLREYLAANGMDGTFENGTMDGWIAVDTWGGDDSSWCTYERSRNTAYTGEYSLKFNARHRTSYFYFNDLKKNTDYYLSFYVTLPCTAEDSQIDNCTVVTGGGSVYNSTPKWEYHLIQGGSGWHKVEVHFNTGSSDWARLGLAYKHGEDWSCGSDQHVYLDDCKLVEYIAKDTLVNGDFAETSNGWVGDYTVTAENTAQLAETGQLLRQAIKLEEQTAYTVSFRSKGSVRGGVAKIDSVAPTDSDLLTSESYTDTAGSDWQSSSFVFYSGVHESTQLFFESLDGVCEIDDVVITKLPDNIGAIVEKIDFETDRFMLNHSDPDVYEIYEAVSSGDSNVHSGTRSLHFKYSEELSETECMLNEAFLSMQIARGISYRLSLYYKLADGAAGGKIKIAPEYRGYFAEDIGTEHSAADNGWQKLTFNFNNNYLSMIKLIISNIADSTKCDFYIDDITLTVIRPLVDDIGSSKQYAALVYNLLENESFEQQVTDADWKGLPATATVVTGDAARGDKYLRAAKDTFYILPVKVDAGKSYYFSASVRGNSNVNGYIALSATPDGRTLYCDANDQEASLIKATSTNWSRSAFRFFSEASGMVYLVISCSNGTLDVDSVMLYEDTYGLEEDPNDYTVTVPYDYDATNSATCVINGGFGDQPYYSQNSGMISDDSTQNDMNTDDDNAPATGDSMAIPVCMAVVLVLTAGIMFGLVMRKKRVAGGSSK